MTDYDTVFLGDENTRLEFEIQDDGVTVDISTASVKQVKFKKPSGTVVVKTANFVTDGSDGLVQYFFESGLIDEEKIWSAWAYVEIGSWKGRSTTYNFLVRSNE
jgi:hypothetical protein